MKRLLARKEDIFSKFFALKNRTEIADLLEVKPEFLIGCIYMTKENDKYLTFEISKRNGKTRKIDAPNTQLKSLQQRFNDVLDVVFKAQSCAHGFVTGKSIVSNSQLHVSKKIVLNIDLEDFFPSIHFGRVRGLFLSRPYSFNNEVATTLAQIACYQGVLPQGAPTSPTISNMILKRLDRELMIFLTSKKCHYTRYADDITISTNLKRMPVEIISSYDPGAIKLSSEFTEIIGNNGFRINDSKINLSFRTKRQEVTGIVTNEKINVKREFYIELRSILYNCMKNGIYDEACKYIAKYPYKIKTNIKNKVDDNDFITTWFIQVLMGKLNFLKMIKTPSNPAFTKLAKEFNILVDKNIFDVDKIVNAYAWIENNLFVVEQCNSLEDCFQGTGLYIGNGYLLTCQHTFKGENNECEVYSANEIFTKHRATIEWSSSESDLAILKVDNLNTIGSHPRIVKSNIVSDQRIRIAGFPNFSPGSTIQRQEGKIIGSNKKFGKTIYNIDAKIITGMSGGPVFNVDFDVIGVIIQGNSNQADADESKESNGIVSLGSLPSKYFIESIN